MTFEELPAQVLELLQCEGRVSYRNSAARARGRTPPAHREEAINFSFPREAGSHTVTGVED
jgi:hypothetical protein